MHHCCAEQKKNSSTASTKKKQDEHRRHIYLIRLATTIELPSVADPLELVTGRRNTDTRIFPILFFANVTAKATSKARSRSSSVISTGSSSPFAGPASSASPLVNFDALGAGGLVDATGHFHDRARYAGPCVSMRHTRRPPPTPCCTSSCLRVSVTTKGVCPLRSSANSSAPASSSMDVASGWQKPAAMWSALML